MSSDFNPTRKDLLLIEQLILDIKSKRNNVINRKINLQNSLSILQAKYKDLTHNSEAFKKNKDDRQRLKNICNELEIKIKSFNEEINAKNKLKNEVEYHLKHNKNLDGREDLDKLIMRITLLTQKYGNFAKDRTRIASLRVMASEVKEELENLLKLNK